MPEQLNAKPLVKRKDLLSGQWKGPNPLLISGRGCACIFPQVADSPIWIPDRLIPHCIEGHSSAPAIAAAGNSRAQGTAARQEPWAGPAWLLGPSVPYSQPVSPARVWACLAAAGSAGGASRAACFRRQKRQDKHRDPSRTDSCCSANSDQKMILFTLF